VTTLDNRLSAFAQACKTKFDAIFTSAANVKSFGAIGDGVTDDTAAIQRAIDSLGIKGGTVLIPNGFQCVVNSGLNVKANVTLKGPFSKVGTPANNTTYPYTQLSCIYLSSAATITLYGGAGIDGLLIQRKGISYPADPTLFAGTAITQVADDSFVLNSMVLGFAQGFLCNGHQRTFIDGLQGDNTAGISIIDSHDIARLNNIHFWPFANISQADHTLYHRSGSAIKLTRCDWVDLINCFSYGYAVGLENDGSDDLTATNFKADGTQLYTGSKGIYIYNDAQRGKFANSVVSSQDIGVHINVSVASNSRTEFTGCDIETSATENILLDAGDMVFNGGSLLNSPYGIKGNSATSRITVDCTAFRTITTQPIAVTSGATVIVRDNDYGTFTGAPVSGYTTPSVASASTVTLPDTGEIFNVTGTTNLTNLQHGWPNRVVKLFFSGSLTLVHSTSSATAMYLKAGANVVVAANSVVELTHFGNQWFQTGGNA
jgi:hypothetical protein